MEEFWEQYNETPLIQKILLFGITAFIIVLAFWFFMYRPIQGEITQTDQKLQNLVKKREKKRQLKERKQKVLDRIETLQDKIVVAEDKLPSSTQLPRLIRLLHEKARASGLEIVDFQRLDDRPQKFYVEIPIQMKFKGTYGELTGFFQFVDRMNRIVSFRDLSLERNEDSSGELTVSAMATTYRYKEKQSDSSDSSSD